MSLFAWRWVQRKIPTDDILKIRGFSMASKCQCCDQEESFAHIFFSGHTATQVWSHFLAIDLAFSSPPILADGASKTGGNPEAIFKNACPSSYFGSCG
ncbi:hypothetical protein F511_26356 [Dorcoceras hygrometricum]|uniref:Reverse transcriptase zinc-binding domain-containing protein n=1 Tax=Dorcoceras hygrometricum TaxID=472368 RepID=A0A2Z7D5Y2_9LAMI|nr:hypothetical protein F511_26356 [Dorcoceras hygrometricum]